MPEDMVDVYFGKSYLARSDVEFQKLGLQGLTLVFATGDSGAAELGPPPEENDCSVLHPNWPTNSPYVVAVGTTYPTPYSEPICFLPISEGGIDCDQNPLGEVAVSLDTGLFWTAGGGFSNFTTQPSYQSQAVNGYLSGYSSLLPPASMFNSKGRAYPDFVTIGHNIMVALNGSFLPVDGTSCSAPIFSAMVTLLNDIRVTAGQKPLGFLNPLFYQISQDYPDAFNDVTIGNNRCGTIVSTPVCCDDGFMATPGWDPVSGLGSPNFHILADLVLRVNSKN